MGRTNLKLLVLLAAGTLLLCVGDASAQPGPAAKPGPIPIHFDDGMLLHDFIVYIQEATQKRIAYDSKLVAGKTIITLGDKLDIPADKAMAYLGQILSSFDLVLVHHNGPPESYMIQQQNKAGAATRTFVQGDAEIPTGSEVISVVYKLKHVGASAVANGLRTMATGVQGTNAIVSVGSSDMVMVTDRAWSVRRLGKIIASIDVPPPEVLTVVYKLQNARADKVAESVDAMMKALSDAARSGTGVQPPPVSPVLVETQINAVIVFATADIQAKVRPFIEKLDSETPPERYTRIYKIKNTEAAAVAYMLGELLDADVASGFTEQPRTGVSRSTGSTSGTGTGAGTDTGVGRDSGAGTGTVGAESRESRVRSEDPEVYGVEIPLIIPDLHQNSLMIRTTEEVHKMVEQIIQDLDARRPQVMLEIVIVEVNDTDNVNIGMELTSLMRRGTNTRGFGTTGFGIADTVFSGAAGLPSGKTLVSPTGGLAGLTSRDQIPVLLRALQSRVKTNVLSTPILLVNDNEEASFSSLDEQPTTSVTQGTQTDQTTFDRFVNAGIEVVIRPLISEGNYITLSISQSVNSFTGEGTGNVPAPRNSNQIDTVITVPNDETVVIGGMTKKSKSKTVSQIPLLGDIPILGWLFRNEVTDERETQIFIFIRPLILDDPEFNDLRGYTRELRDKSGLKLGQPKPVSETLKNDDPKNPVK